MIFSQLPDDVTIIHPAATADEYGNPVLEFTVNATHTQTKGWLQREQGTGGETPGQERSPSIMTFRLYLPAKTPIGVRDRVEISGTTYTVHGEPNSVRGLRGVSHILARLRLLVG